MELGMDDSDESDYDSSDDDDYVPEGNISGSDASDPGDNIGGKRKGKGKTPSPKKRKTSAGKRKSPRKKTASKKRTGGIRLDKEHGTDSDSEDDDTEEESEDDDIEMKKLEARLAREEEKKKQIDKLWASFKEDTGRPKKTRSSDKVHKDDEGKICKDTEDDTNNKTTEESPEKEAKIGSKTISVTQTFDFAGEEIKVTKEIDADSDEARKIIKKEELRSAGHSPKKPLDKGSAPESRVTKEIDADSDEARKVMKEEEFKSTERSPKKPLDKDSAPESRVTEEIDDELDEAKKVKKEELKSTKSSPKKFVGRGSAPGSSGVKRSGGLGGFLGSIGKKTSMSTLEKTKLDWETFKKDEGIEDELRTQGRAGFLDRKEFLQRADYRQWENEREIRLATSRSKR